LKRQTVLDVVVDEKLSAERLTKFRAVILPQALALSDAQLAALRSYAQGGGQVLVYGDVGTLNALGGPRAQIVSLGDRIDAQSPDAAAEAIEKKLRAAGGSVIKSPWTVRAATYTKALQVVLHLVNYNRDESDQP